MPAEIGSLADYDAILSISEEAINRQLQLLYDKKIEVSDDLPPPTQTPVANGAPAAPSHYLINHELEIHLFDDQGILDEEEGLSGHIECPKISFTDVNLPNNFRTGKISFKFKKDPASANPNSVFNYWSGRGRSATIKSVPLNEYTMSWEVNFGRFDVHNVMEELIKPAEDRNNPSVLHPNTTKELTKFVDSRNFLVSSIFCLFQASQMANTFELKDPAGKKAEIGSVEGDFMLLVSKYFTGLQVPPGHMTPDYPFVLGYGISQNLPPLAAVNPNIDPKLTPRFFIPKSFQLTATPGTVQANGTKFTNGTLNFCMLTYRSYYPGTNNPMPGRVTNGEANPSAGVLPATFFDVTKTSVHDGIMGFSQDLIMHQYIATQLAPALFIQPMHFGQLKDASLSRNSEKVFYDGSPSVYNQQVEFQTTMTEGEFKTSELYFSLKWSKGSSAIKVQLSSDLMQDPTKVPASDEKRRGYIDIFLDATLSTMYETQSQFRESPTEQYLGTLTMKYRIRLVLQAGSGGVWSVVTDPVLTKLPQFGADGNIIALRQGPTGDYGTFLTGEKRNTFWQIFGSNDELERTMLSVQFGASKAIQDVSEGLTNLLKSLQTTVIMPAGDAFMFTGIDTDKDGNLYSHVTYTVGAEGAQRNG